MRGLDYDLPNPCSCSVQKNNQCTSRNIKFSDNNANSDFENRNNCSRQNASSQNSQRPVRQELDNQTWKNLSSMRDKACKFIKSESECNTSTSDSSFLHCICKSEKCCREKCLTKDVLNKNAKDFVDYVPESSFLKKIKEKCQYMPNADPMQNFLPTFSDAVNPSLCEKCYAKAQQKLSGQNTRPQSQGSNQNSEFCWCKDPTLKSRGIDFILNTCKSAIEEYKNNMLGNKYCGCENCTQENKGNVKEKKNSNRKEKSRRKSKSRKINKCHDRRKRKSNDPEQSDSQDCFEPSLKRPHENSCERCWRYASPSRSPVNKPDQRFDPNFRKAHSCTDFINRDEEEESDNTEEEARRPLPCRQTAATTRINELEFHNQNSRGETEVKELVFQPTSQVPRASERRIPRVFASEGNRQCDSRDPPRPGGIIYAGQVKKPRPKSCTPGLPSGKVNCVNCAENLKSTKYIDTQIQPSKHQSQNIQELSNRPMKCNEKPKSPKENTRSLLNPCEILDSRQMNKNSIHASRRAENIESNRSTVCTGNAQTHSSQINAPSWHSGSSRNSRPPTPSSKRSNVRMDQGSVPQVPEAHSPNCIHFKANPPSKVQQSDQVPTGGTHSCGEIQENQPQIQDLRPKSLGFDIVLYNDSFNEFPNQDVEAAHQLRGCNCSRPQQAKGTGCPIGRGSEKKIYCCHCHQRECSRNQTVRYDNENQSFPRQNNCENEGRFSSRLQENQGNIPNCEPNTDVNQRNEPYRSYNDEYMKNYSGRTMQCPYSEHRCNKIPLLTITSADNPVESHGQENFPPGNYRCNPPSENYRCNPPPENYRCNPSPENYRCNPPSENYRGNPPPDCQPSYNPTKYSVYYMTKSKERGNEVEVLVEELTERCWDNKKDSKTKAVKNKMEKLLECNSDSMALRFQKGVNDPFRSPQGSRVLYF